MISIIEQVQQFAYKYVPGPNGTLVPVAVPAATTPAPLPLTTTPATQQVAGMAATNRVPVPTPPANPQPGMPAARPVSPDLAQAKYSLKMANAATNPAEKAMHTDTGFAAAKRVNAAARAPVAPPVVPQPVAQPAAVVPQAVVPQPAAAVAPVKELGGLEHAGRAAQKGLQTAGEAAGSASKKAMELAAEHPAIAGLTAGAVGALGLKKLLNRNKQQ